ncbi:hypothetical protein CEQ90_09010 [Lewinellaceae bacterium SD302]|nr:hypothetical protein CEQ90_09010 [Lewinellaceae bacterium SD302]
MKHLNFILFLLVFGVSVSCNSPKDGMAKPDEEATVEASEVNAENIDEKVDEIIETYASTAQLTNVQEQQIRDIAKKYDLFGGTDAENQLQRRLLRKEVIGTVLTEQQVSDLRRERQSRKRNGGGK